MNRRNLLGLFGAAAVTPMLPALPVASAPLTFADLFSGPLTADVLMVGAPGWRREAAKCSTINGAQVVTFTSMITGVIDTVVIRTLDGRELGRIGRHEFVNPCVCYSDDVWIDLRFGDR